MKSNATALPAGSRRWNASDPAFASGGDSRETTLMKCSRIGVGAALSLGIGLGAALGSALESVALGVSLGLASGLALYGLGRRRGGRDLSR